MVYIVVEGNISSGKSSLIQYLESNYPVDIALEPVLLWQNYHNVNTLEEFYKDMKGHGLGFQLVVCDTFCNAQEELLRKSNAIKIQDRYPKSGLEIFTPLLDLPDYEKIALRNMINRLPIVEPDIVVYLKCPVSVCQERLRIRNRSEESGVSVEYHSALEKSIETWIAKQKNVIVLDGTKNTSNIANELYNTITKL